MIKSMTGFGQVTKPVNDSTVLVEVKTINSKFLDLSLRLPKIFSDKETEIRNLITEKLERGKVTVTVEYTNQPGAPVTQQYNEAAFLAHYAELKKLADRVLAPHDQIFELALRSPDVELPSEREILDPAAYEKFLKILNEAIQQCDAFRMTEGAHLSGKFKEYIQSISGLLLQVEKLDPLRVDKIRTRIRKNVTDFFGEQGFDTNRLEQEIIFYIEKLDITEERVRLKSHLNYFLKVIDESQSNGKKLGFISQEIGREINTIGSKANDAEIQMMVVSMKEEVEKIKEQLNNII